MWPQSSEERERAGTGEDEHVHADEYAVHTQAHAHMRTHMPKTEVVVGAEQEDSWPTFVLHQMKRAKFYKEHPCQEPGEPVDPLLTQKLSHQDRLNSTSQ